MGYTSQAQDFVRRHPAISALVAIILGSGVVFSVSNSSGQKEFIVDEYGNVTASGAIATKNLTASACTDATTSKLLTSGTGMLICGTDQTGAGISAVDAEGMFVNQGGDTMTGSLTINANMTAYHVAASGAPNCDSIDSTSTGMLVCGTDAGFTWAQTQTLADPQYVNVGGDTMTGALTVHGTMSGSSLTVIGRPLIQRIVAIPLCDGATACAAGSGSTFRVPKMMDGMTMSGVTLDASIPGTTGTMTVQLWNQTDNCYMLSTAVTLDTTEPSSDTAATPPVINAACRVIGNGDRIIPQVSGVHTTPAKGVTVQLHFIP